MSQNQLRNHNNIAKLNSNAILDQDIPRERSDNPCFDDALYHDSFGNHSLSVTTRIDFSLLLPSGNNKRPTESGRKEASLPFHATGSR